MSSGRRSLEPWRRGRQFWEELGRSATAPAGISGSVRGVVPAHRNVSITIDASGRPVVVYTDWDAIVVKRWNGVEWENLGQPGGGHEPHVSIYRNGRIVAAWLQFIPTTESGEAFLAVRDGAGTEWQLLGGSGSGGGIGGDRGRGGFHDAEHRARRRRAAGLRTPLGGTGPGLGVRGRGTRGRRGPMDSRSPPSSTPRRSSAVASRASAPASAARR